MQSLWSEDNVDERRTLRDAFAFLARHTATNANHYARTFRLEQAPATELGENFFLRLLTNRTGIDEQQVGFARIIDQLVAVRLAQDVRHLVRVVLVHLAAHRFDE